MYTTTSAPFAEPLRGDTDPLAVLGADALSEVARSATLAQNLAGATRLEAAHHTVRTLERINRALDQDDPAAARRPAHARLDPAAQARDHLCAALKVTTWHAARLVTAGVQIHTRLPRLRSAVQRGLLPEQLAIDTACRLADVPRAILPAVESDVVASLTRDLDGGHRPSRTALDTLVDTALERHDPHAAENAVADATEHRTVRFRPDRAGMTSMWARLPSAAAEKLRRRIDAAARAAQHAGHPRTRNQLRADALTALGDPTTDDIGSHTDTDTDSADTDTGTADTTDRADTDTGTADTDETDETDCAVSGTAGTDDTAETDTDPVGADQRADGHAGPLGCSIPHESSGAPAGQAVPGAGAPAGNLAQPAGLNRRPPVGELSRDWFRRVLGQRGDVLAGTARLADTNLWRLLCNPVIHTFVTDSAHEILQMGRAVRLATPAQRRALRMRDGGCVFQGCDAPIGWTQAHHVVHWSTGGRSDLASMGLLCTTHHDVTHRRDWQMLCNHDPHNQPDGTFRWISPSGDVLWSQRHGEFIP